jgi:hypothetical protein
MKEGESIHELFAMNAPMSEEDRVICLLASLPESFGALLEANLKWTL